MLRLLVATFLALLCCFGQARESGGDTPTIDVAALPFEARQTLRLIETGGPFPFPRDGIVFGNYERQLPRRARGYYHEYTVPTPGLRSRGARRIVAGEQGERYYSADHYQTFQWIRQ